MVGGGLKEVKKLRGIKIATNSSKCFLYLFGDPTHITTLKQS
jgi:hypothetical protein